MHVGLRKALGVIWPVDTRKYFRSFTSGKSAATYPIRRGEEKQAEWLLIDGQWKPPIDWNAAKITLEGRGGGDRLMEQAVDLKSLIVSESH